MSTAMYLALSTSVAAAAAGRVAQSWPTQVPFWPVYPNRNVQTLNGTWQFGFSTGVDPVTVQYSDITTPNTTNVPGAFDVQPPGILGPRGTAFFRSTHACSPGTAALLKFYAVNFYARVFVDGVDIGNHTAGGYTPFEMLSPLCAADGVRELLVVCNNEKNDTTNPTNQGGDFYFYSGIIRPVVVTELPPSGYPFWLDRVEPISVDYVKGLIDIRVLFGGDTSNSSSVHLAYGFNGAAVGTVAAYPVVNGTVIIPNVAVPDFKPWTLGQGNLYTLTVFEGALNDSITVRSGVRVLGIDTATARVTINGEVVKLVGFNRHTMWPDTGAAVTPEQEAIDLQVVQGVNANYIRGAHYPQSQSWLDRLDEAGIVIWEETLGPGTSTNNMNDPWFMHNHLTAVASMVGTSFAHPSVIIHGFFNEGPSNDPAACVGYAATSELIKSLVSAPSGPMRLVTWANDHLSGDVCIAYEDVISFNSYPGWYDHPGNVTYPAVFWAQQVAWVESNWPDTPLFVSETGGGGVYEWSNDSAPFPGPFWSMAYQKALVPADASYIVGEPRISGLTLWQLNDIKANDADTASCGQCDYLPHPDNLSVPWNCGYISVSCGRPGGENHKGTVDFWRREKEEYPVIAAIYGNASAAAAAGRPLDGVTERA